MAALDGIRVLDFTQVIFGPAATQVLADHGADVIKVERPGQGDLARAFGPWKGDQSLPFASLNRNKRSLVVDLKEAEGLQLIHRLLEGTDVLVHNFRSGAVMQKLGLDYDSLKEKYPRLIYAAGSGYGSSGPYVERGKGGHESMAQALSGMAARFIGPTDTPQRLPYTVADFTGGMLLVQGVLLALLARERTGQGQYLETSLLDGMMTLQAWETTRLLNAPHETDDGSGGATDPNGNPLDGAVFKTADGFLMVTALFRPFDVLMQDLEEALGVEGLAGDPRFASLDKAKEHRAALRQQLDPVFLQRPSHEWVPRLEARDILVAPVRTTEEALQDPQLEVNGMLVEVEHPTLGTLRHVGPPLRLQGTPAQIKRAAPLLGEDTADVLRTAGLSAAEAEDLHQRGIVG
ncbi:MAG: CoA transferase [Candidatus Latescibacteria bacterium]|nr:CoA transferase [Candidatus Latescibacterota bacterium]